MEFYSCTKKKKEAAAFKPFNLIVIKKKIPIRLLSEIMDRVLQQILFFLIEAVKENSVFFKLAFPRLLWDAATMLY